jgi:hypothetical protein
VRDKVAGGVLISVALTVMMVRNGGVIPGGLAYVAVVSVLGFLGAERLGLLAKSRSPEPPETGETSSGSIESGDVEDD